MPKKEKTKAKTKSITIGARHFTYAEQSGNEPTASCDGRGGSGMQQPFLLCSACDTEHLEIPTGTVIIILFTEMFLLLPKFSNLVSVKSHEMQDNLHEVQTLT